ncbi:hypothetical protein TNCV_466651 [Trichonephila clavipes]|nr:hypothetical protein TNCV_466651 [Trichonephila clavipes]
MPLDNKCRIGPLAGAPPDTCAVVISTETESGFITEMTRLQSVTSKLPEVGKIQSTLPMMWGQCDVVGAQEVATLLIARSSRSFVFLGRPDPPRRYTLPSVIHCCQHPEQLPYRSDRGGDRYVYSTNLRFSEAYYTAPIKVRQLLVLLPPVTSFRGILSLNIVYQSHQIRLDSRTALVLMLLNSPSCATINMRIART